MRQCAEHKNHDWLVLCGSYAPCKQKFLLCNLKTVSDILATFVLLTWSMSILVENCKMDGSQIWNFLCFGDIVLEYM